MDTASLPDSVRPRRSLGLRGALALIAVVAMPAFLHASPARADFGIAAVTATAVDRDGTLDFQAGSHPFEFTLALELNQDGSGEPEGSLRALRLDLPAGFVGNPLAVPRCQRQDFEGDLPRCAGSSQIGVVRLQIAGLGETVSPLYNAAPPPGAIASFGFSANGSNGFEQASLRTGGDYGLSATVAPIPDVDPRVVSQTIWGVPADPAHDPERVCFDANGDRVEGCASDAPEVPFLTLPGSCAGPLRTTAFAESVQQPGAFASKTVFSLDAGGNPAALVGCEALSFDPAMAVRFESAAADSPTGLDVDVHLPQFEDAKTLAAAALKRAVIDLPEGVAINPPVAAGLGACSPAQIGLRSPPGSPAEFTPAAAACPEAARVGTVELRTPVVDHVLQGGLYLATPYENPSGSLFAIYVAVDDRQSGIVLKLPARLEAEPRGGRLRLRLEEAPQLPFEDLSLSFRGGSRAALRTPPVCGTGLTAARFTPWSEPGGADAKLVSSFRTSAAAAGAGACPTTEAQAPSAPSFTAGTLVPAAGRYSPFLFRIGRADGTQRLGSVEATLPPGLTAKLAGVPYCRDAAIAAGTCPLGAEVGSVDVAAGAGPLPLHLGGRAYLAGPYEGAPLSLAILTPALAGPFDLGTVAVRVALHVDPRSARIRAVSDPLPTILRGIPLDIRSLTLTLDRPGFTLNPSSCAPGSVASTATSRSGQATLLGARFQAADCAALGFEPAVSVRLLGPTHRGAHPKLRTVLAPRAGDANIGRVAVVLPGTELLDNRHIGAICPAERFAAGRCPASSIYGHAKAWTPLLDRPLEGPIYLRASGTRLPDLAVSLDGQVHIDLVGGIDSVRGRLRNTFRALPDAPLSRVVLTMKGGRKGLLVNSGGLCARERRGSARFAGQNGKRHELSPVVKTDCGKR